MVDLGVTAPRLQALGQRAGVLTGEFRVKEQGSGLQTVRVEV